MANFLSADGIKLSFPVEPLPVQSARFYRSGRFLRSYQPEKITSFKQFIRIYASSQLPDGFQILDSPLAVEADFVFLPPQSIRKKERAKIASGEIVYKDRKPDLTDNLMKGVADALTGIVWTDDARVCEVRSRKRYGTAPGIFLNIKVL